MNLEVLGAVVQGYSDRIQDQELLSIQSGYWSGYWSNSKHPKTLGQIIDMATRKRDTVNSKKEHAEDVDVEAFLERERKFNERRDTLAR